MMSQVLVSWIWLGARILSGLACLTLFGCATPDVSTTSSRIGATGIGPQDRISVILLDESEGWNSGLCLEESIRESSNDVLTNFVPARGFVASAFPGQSTEHVGRLLKSGDYVRHLAEPSTVARVASLNVRYLIIAHLRTVKSDESPSCGVADPRGGGGCIEKGRRDTTLEAEIIDVAKGAKLGTASAHANGSRGSGLIMLLILPIPLAWSSPTETAACEAIGKPLAELILNLPQQTAPASTPSVDVSSGLAAQRTEHANSASVPDASSGEWVDVKGGNEIPTMESNSQGITQARPLTGGIDLNLWKVGAFYGDNRLRGGDMYVVTSSIRHGDARNKSAAQLVVSHGCGYCHGQDDNANSYIADAMVNCDTKEFEIRKFQYSQDWLAAGYLREMHVFRPPIRLAAGKDGPQDALSLAASKICEDVQ